MAKEMYVIYELRRAIRTCLNVFSFWLWEVGGWPRWVERKGEIQQPNNVIKNYDVEGGPRRVGREINPTAE